MASYSSDEKVVREGFWRKALPLLAHVPFAEDLLAAFYCAFDPQTPARVKAVLFGALAYFIMPFDAISDLLPLIGMADDAAVLAAALATVRGAITDAHRTLARHKLDEAALAQRGGKA